MKHTSYKFTLGLLLTATTVFSQIPTNGLVAFYPFNGNANDESGNNNNGAVNGASLASDRFGKANCSYSFNGNGNYIQVANSANINPLDISFNFWVKPNQTSTYSRFFSKMDHVNANFYSYGVGLNPNKTISIGWAKTGCDQIQGQGGASYNGDSVIKTNDWSMITISLTSNGKLEYFINGILIKSQIDSVFKACNDPVSVFRFGQWWDKDNQWYNGLLDDFRIYNRILTQQDINNLLNDVIVTSINGTIDGASENSFKIYPNPASDNLTIENSKVSTMSGHTLQVTDALGQTIFSSAINQNRQTINLDNWKKKSLYIVKLLDSQNTVVETQKIILQ